MIRTVALALLTVMTVSACSQCNVKEGSYTSAGGSEQNTKLTLSSNKSFFVIHEAWQPGHYEKRNTFQLSGTWACNRNSITFDNNEQQYKAELVTIGENPLGLKTGSQALIFEEAKDSYLNKQVFYPDL
ncbi:MAG: hypothetical protein OEY89_06730 [Gammaproteobacteria bacterium]|nr:hypothetical protein [Gammaproteobacteria bacterium]